MCVNKWDEVAGHGAQKKNALEASIRDQFKFLDYAPIIFLSAKSGTGVGKLFKLIQDVYQAATRRITTGELNRFVEQLHFEERKIYYITQHSIRPPAFAVFTDRGGALHFRGYFRPTWRSNRRSPLLGAPSATTLGQP